MSNVISTVKLHLNKREMTFLVPLYITALVVVISVLISLLFWRAGSAPGSDGWVTGSRNNPAMLWSLPGFLVYMGVQSVATTFPFALTLGATRRAFAGGTLLWAAVTSAYLTAVLTLLTLLELATNHWFAGFYLFDVFVLGAGNIWVLIPSVFLGTLFCLTAGGVFGAVWVRYGARGPLLLGAAIAIVVIIGLIIILPGVADIFASFELWWLAVFAAVAILLSALGVWRFLRPAIVR